MKFEDRKTELEEETVAIRCEKEKEKVGEKHALVEQGLARLQST